MKWKVERSDIRLDTLMARAAMKWLRLRDSTWRMVPPTRTREPDNRVLLRPMPSLAYGAIGIAWNREVEKRRSETDNEAHAVEHRKRTIKEPMPWAAFTKPNSDRNHEDKRASNTINSDTLPRAVPFGWWKNFCQSGSNCRPIYQVIAQQSFK